MTDKQAITVKDALNAMAFYLKEQPELAWSWHCNIAMTAVDAGAPHLEANKRTADFMRSAFGVDVTDFKEYKSIMQIYETLNAAPSKDALEWQPIKTAPKDGTEMLLFNDKKKYLANGCFGQKGHEYANPNVWVWPYINLEPTHWMTLPRALINAHEVK